MKSYTWSIRTSTPKREGVGADRRTERNVCGGVGGWGGGNKGVNEKVGREREREDGA